MFPHWIANGRRRIEPLVEALRRENLNVISVNMLEKRTGLSRQAARTIAARLVTQGHAVRVGRGLYRLTGSEANVLAAELHQSTSGAPLSHGSAMAAHGWGPPLPHGTLYALREGRRGPRVVPGRYEVRFVVPAPDLPSRETVVDAPGVGPVRVTDLETTLLHAVHRPGYCGGILNVARFMTQCRSRLRLDVLVDDAQKAGPADRARVGLLLEVAGLLTDPHREFLRRDLPVSWPPLDLSVEPRGQRVAYWGLVLNVPFDELQQAAKPAV